MWGLRIRFPVPPGRAPREHGGRRRRREPADPDAPRLAGVPRTTELRRVIRREARLYRSPLRWTLLFAAFVGAILGLSGESRAASLLCLVALFLAPFAAFGGRRGIRGAAAGVVLAAGALAWSTGALPLSGVLLLVAGFFFAGQALTGPNAEWVRKRSRQWIRDHARPPGPPSPEARGRVEARARARILVDRVRTERARLASPLRWCLLVAVAFFAVLAMFDAPVSRHSFPFFAAALVLPAAALAAFAAGPRTRRLAALAVLPVAGGLALSAGATAVVAAAPIAAAAVALFLLAGDFGLRPGSRSRGSDPGPARFGVGSDSLSSPERQR